jgi:hypothetical protein
MVPKANKTSSLQQESRTIGFRKFLSVFVRADFKDYDRNVTEAEGEGAFGFVIISDGLSIPNNGDERKGPELAAEKIISRRDGG